MNATSREECSGMIVDAINLPARLATTLAGGIGDICALLDSFGEETDDDAEAVVVIVHWRDGGFSPVDLADFEIGAGLC